MSNISLPVNPGESKTLTFNTADTYMPEDLVFNITSSSNYIVGNPLSPGTPTPNSVAAVTTSPYYSTIWRGNCDNITALYSGLRVAYKIPTSVPGSSYGVVLDINGLGEHPVVYNVNSNIGTRYSTGSIVDLIYDAQGTGTVYLGNGSTTVTGVWKICDYSVSDTNTWRTVQVNGTTKIANTSSTALNIKNGEGTSVAYNSGVKIDLSGYSVDTTTLSSSSSLTVTNNKYYTKYISANTTISVTPSSTSGAMCYVLVHNTASSAYSVTFSAASGTTLIGNGAFNVPANSYIEFSIITTVASSTSVLTYSSVMS